MDNTFFDSKNVIIDKDSMWILTNESGVLCQFDFSSWRLLSYYVIPDDIMRKYSYLAFAQIDRIFYVLPYQAEYMFIIDTVNSIIKKIVIPYFKQNDEERDAKFVIAEKIKEKLIIVGHNVTGLFFYDAKGFRLNVDYIAMFKREGIVFEKEKPFFSDSYLICDNQMLIPIFARNYLLSINVDTEKLELRKVCDNVRLRTIDVVDKESGVFFFTTIDDEKVIWSSMKGIIERNELGLLSGENTYYARALFMNGKYYYFAACEKRIFVEKKEKIKELYLDGLTEGRLEEGATQFEAIFVKDNSIYFQVRSDGSFYCIDTSEDIIKKLEFRLTQKERDMLVKESYVGKKMHDLFQERNWFSLKNFVDII